MSNFEQWMADTPASVNVAVSDDAPEEGVIALKPLGNAIEQGALGYTGPDFVPGTPLTKSTPTRSSLRVDGPVILDPSGEDYVPHNETVKRSSIREKLIERYTEEIMKEYADANLRFQRASAFVEKHSQSDELDDKTAERLQRAISIVEQGVPMTVENARTLAVKRASTEVIR